MQLKKLKVEMGCALLFMGFSLLLWYLVIPLGVPLRTAYGSSTGVTSRTFPYFAAVVMGTVSFVKFCKDYVQFIKVKRETKDQQNESVIFLNPKEEVKALFVYVLFVLYAILFSKLGYIISTFLVPTILLFFLGERKIARYLIIYSVGVFLFLVFEKFLLVQLP